MSKWIAEFELEDGDTMPEHMDLNYMGSKIDFHCRPKEPILDKIRAEIEELEEGITSYYNDRPWIFKDEVLAIIDKYKAEDKEMNEQMEFPETFERFAKEYGFKDDKEVYTNGSDLIPIFRVKQWLEHDNKLRTIETDTAYECGKHANKWIPVSERLPEEYGEYLITWTTSQSKRPFIGISEGEVTGEYDHEHNRFKFEWLLEDYVKNYPDVKVIAWMPLPKPWKKSEGE